MRSLFAINKIKKKKDRQYYESAINQTLKTVGIKVSGDVLDEMKYPYTKWPDDFGHTDLKLKLIEWYEKN